MIRIQTYFELFIQFFFGSHESLKALHSENPWTGGYGDSAYYTPTFAFQDGLNWQYWGLINNVLHTTRCLSEREREGCDCLTTKVISICFMFKTKLYFRERNHQHQRYTWGIRFCISRLLNWIYLFKLGIQRTVLLIRYLFRH